MIVALTYHETPESMRILPYLFLAALLLSRCNDWMRRALTSGNGMFFNTFYQYILFSLCPRSLSDLGDRSEGKLF